MSGSTPPKIIETIRFVPPYQSYDTLVNLELVVRKGVEDNVS